jgi:integrase
MGLGGFPDVTLAMAREAARSARARIVKGIDPIEEAKSARAMLKLAQANAVTFETAATTYVNIHEPSWSNVKHAQQWRNTISTHANPVLGAMLVRDIGLPHVLQVLEPIWRTKTETATRVRSRIESVLNWATTKGYREGLNPARWKGHLDNVLPQPSKVAKEKHYAALPIPKVGAFMAALRQHEGIGSKALEFAILTVTRSNEIRGAKWSEIDLDGALWTIPAERMKMRVEHRVPLSARAVELLSALPRFPTDVVFVAPRGGELSNGTLNAVIDRMGVQAVQHGFRSTFRDWAAEHTNYPPYVAEMALAHAIGDKVEAAYRRGDLFLKRKAMMKDWAAFCSEAPIVPEVIKGQFGQGSLGNPS